jgi:hypothetical protein
MMKICRWQGVCDGLEGGSKMLSLKVKFVILLITYFAGFATAIYMLAPASQQNGQGGLDSSFASGQLVQSLNTGLQKCVAVTKAAAKDAGGYIRQKLNETEHNQP